MGNSASVQTIINDINNSVTTMIQNEAGSVSETNCDINVDFQLKTNNNCDIEFKNYCLAESSVTIENMVTAIATAYDKLTEAQQEAVAGFLQNNLNIETTDNNINNSISTYLNNKCSSISTTTNVINSTFKMNECNSTGSPRVKILFLNTGQALSNCIVTNVINDTLNAANTVSEDQKTGVDWADILRSLLWPVCLAVIVIVGMYALLTFIRSKKPLNPNEQVYLELAKNNSWAANALAMQGRL